MNGLKPAFEQDKTHNEIRETTETRQKQGSNKAGLESEPWSPGPELQDLNENLHFLSIDHSPDHSTDRSKGFESKVLNRKSRTEGPESDKKSKVRTFEIQTLDVASTMLVYL